VAGHGEPNTAVLHASLAETFNSLQRGRIIVKGGDNYRRVKGNCVNCVPYLHPSCGRSALTFGCPMQLRLYGAQLIHSRTEDVARTIAA
jgi:hypothetical protein